MRKGLIIFSPLPPLRNGIADYVARLLPFHAKEYDCAVVISDSTPDPEGLPKSVGVLREAQYRQHINELCAYTHVFHLGNNGDHAYMLPYLQTTPGLAIVHDLSLHHLMKVASFDGTLDRSAYVRSLWASHGYHGRLLARQDADNDWKSLTNYIECHSRPEALDHATGLITHSKLGLARLKSAYREPIIHYIPHFADLAVGSREKRRSAARQHLNIPLDVKLLLALGFVTNAKQLLDVMDAVRTIANATTTRFRLLIAGQENDFSISPEAKKRNVESIVTHTGYIREEDISLYLDAADVLINLRFPTFGETSGSLCRALGRGVCALVSNHGWYAELPDNAVIKVPARRDIADVIAGSLYGLFSKPKLQSEIEQAATAFAARELKIDIVAAKYNEVIRDLPTPGRIRSSSNTFATVSSCVGPKETKRRVPNLPGARQNGASKRYLGSMWWSQGHVPLPQNQDAILISGPPSLKYSAKRIFGCRVTVRSNELRSCGLYIGTWEELFFDGCRLGRFCSSLRPGGLAFLNIWASPEGSALTSLSRTVGVVEDALARFGLEVLLEAGPSANLHEQSHERRLPLWEKGVLTRRV